MNEEQGGQRVAFFGGSFDPPHLGHLTVARAACTALALDTVLFAPVGVQPLKPHGSSANFEDRVAMTRLAIEGERSFDLSLADAPTPAGTPNYTFETLLRLRAEHPDGALFCLMGADSFLQLRHWRRAAEIPFIAPLIVASRPGQPLHDLKAVLPSDLTMEPFSGPPPASSTLEVRLYLLANAAGNRTPFYLLPGLHVEISATEVRDQIRGQVRSATIAPHGLLPIAVSDYIRAHGLYR